LSYKDNGPVTTDTIANPYKEVNTESEEEIHKIIELKSARTAKLYETEQHIFLQSPN